MVMDVTQLAMSNTAIHALVEAETISMFAGNTAVMESPVTVLFTPC